MSYTETTSKRVIARRVAKARRASRETLKEFGEHFGVHPLTVWRWEHGVKAPRLRHQRTLLAIEIQLANAKLARKAVTHGNRNEPAV